MSRHKGYDFEKYSIFDMKEYVSKKGYKIKEEYYRQHDTMFILGTDVRIDFVCISVQGPDAYIRFEDYPRTENYEESKKLFEALKRKFGLKKDERPPKRIKDIEKMEIIDWMKGGKRFKGEKLKEKYGIKDEKTKDIDEKKWWQIFIF